jgi:tetratricopeptide (TPR) repeat protein
MPSLLQGFETRFDPAQFQGQSNELLGYFLDKCPEFDKPWVRALMDDGVQLADLCNLESTHIDAMLLRGIQTIEVGDFQNAEEWFRFLLFLAPFDPRVQYGAGTASQMCGNYARACELYMFALALDALNPDPMLRIGDCHIAVKEYGDARDYYTEAIRIAEGTPKEANVKAHVERMQAFMDAKA